MIYYIYRCGSDDQYWYLTAQLAINITQTGGQTTIEFEFTFLTETERDWLPPGCTPPPPGPVAYDATAGEYTPWGPFGPVEATVSNGEIKATATLSSTRDIIVTPADYEFDFKLSGNMLTGTITMPSEPGQYPVGGANLVMPNPMSLTLTGPIPVQTPSITLSPSVGPAGTVVTVKASGFAPNNKIDIKWETQDLGKLSTDGNGGTQGTFTIGNGTPTGEYTVTATDTAGGSATATFTVILPGQHKVTFTESGLPAGTEWWVQVPWLNGERKTTTKTSVDYYLDDGQNTFGMGIPYVFKTADWPLTLSNVRGSTPVFSGMGITMNDSVLVDGYASKPENLYWWQFNPPSSRDFTVSGADMEIPLTAQEITLNDHEDVSVSYSLPRGPPLKLAASNPYFLASGIPSTLSLLFPAELLTQMGAWTVQASADIKLSGLSGNDALPETFSVTSNALSFNIAPAQPLTMLSVRINGVDSKLALYSNNPAATPSNAGWGPSGNGYDLTFNVAGPSGNSSILTVAIPKTAVPSGFYPTAYVNGALATQQSTEDDKFYYVSVQMHFSTDQVTIHFSPSSPIPPPPPPPFPYWLLLVAAAIISAVLFAGALAYRRKHLANRRSAKKP